MLTCREASMLVSQSIERRLPWRSRVALRLHLLACAACTQFKRQAELIHRAAREYARRLPAAADLGLSEAARERLRRAVADFR